MCNPKNASTDSDELCRNNDVTNATKQHEVDKMEEVLINHHLDSRRWRQLTIRDDDVLVGAYPKSGTTWMQYMVQKLLDIPDNASLDEKMPWFEFLLPPIDEVVTRLEAQQHRRSIKHHLARDYLPSEVLERASHVYIARDGRDVLFSIYNHHSSYNPGIMKVLDAVLPKDAEPLPDPGTLPDPVTYFRVWLDKNGHPFWPYWEHIRSWWAARNEPNVLLVHYNALKRNHAGEILRLLKFLRRNGEVVQGDDNTISDKVANESSFGVMKKNAKQFLPTFDVALKNGTDSFFYKGTNNRWRDVLPDELVKQYEKKAVEELGEECARWLSTGVFPDGSE